MSRRLLGLVGHVYLLPCQVCEFFVEAFINLDSEVDRMHSSFVRKLNLRISNTQMNTWKTNANRLKTYKMVIVSF